MVEASNDDDCDDDVDDDDDDGDGSSLRWDGVVAGVVAVLLLCVVFVDRLYNRWRAELFQTRSDHP